MIISIDGMPGCYQEEIYQKLAEHGFPVKSCSKRDNMFWSNTMKYGLCHQLDWLSRLKMQYEEPGNIYDSVYSHRELYPVFYKHKSWINLDEYEADILNRYYDLEYQSERKSDASRTGRRV